MIENAKYLNTRIILKNDTLANWNDSTLILQKGEVAFAEIIAADNYDTPTYLMKVGDGSNTFSDLKWVAANAADVYGWAKSKEIKVDGTGNAVTGVSVVNNSDGTTSVVLNKTVTFATKAELDTFTNTTLATVLDEYITETELTNILKDYVTNESLTETLNGYTKVGHNHVASDITDLDSTIKSYDYATKTEAKNYADAKDAAIKAAQDAVDAIEADYLTSADKTELQENINSKANIDDVGSLRQTVESVSGSVQTLVGTDSNKSVRTIANEELAAQLITSDAAENLDTLQEIAAWIQEHPEDAAAMNSAIAALQNQLIGIDAGEGTVKKYIDEAITALKIGDYAKASDLTALAGRVTTIEGKVSTWDAAEQNAKNYADTKVAELSNGAVKDNAEAISDINDELDTYGDIVTHDATEFATANSLADTNTEVAKKANDADLAAIAKSGSTDDLVQGDLVLVFDCGTSN